MTHMPLARFVDPVPEVSHEVARAYRPEPIAERLICACCQVTWVGEKSCWCCGIAGRPNRTDRQGAPTGPNLTIGQFRRS
jgi:hypothetical protein